LASHSKIKRQSWKGSNSYLKNKPLAGIASKNCSAQMIREIKGLNKMSDKQSEGDTPLPPTPNPE